MNDNEKFQHIKAGLRFCPECGVALEKRSYVDTLSCFAHGDMLMVWVNGDIHVQWRALRAAQLNMPAEKIDSEATIERTMYGVETPRKQTEKIVQICKWYDDGDITFDEAAEMIHEAEYSQTPKRLSVVIRQRAQQILKNHGVLEDMDQFNQRVWNERKQYNRVPLEYAKVAEQYHSQKMSFLDAAVNLAFLRRGVEPDEPTQSDRDFARYTLDKLAPKETQA